MNNKNRETVRNAINKLEDLSNTFNNIKGLNDINDVIDILEELKDGEFGKFDNMSEGLQQTSKGEDIGMAADTLDECYEALKELELDSIQEKINDVIWKLNDLI